MGVSQSTPVTKQEYIKPKSVNQKKLRDDDPIMNNIKSKDLFYYIVPLKDKNNNIIDGYDLMIAVNNKHEIETTKVMSMEDYNQLGGSEEFKNKFNELNKKAKQGGRGRSRGRGRGRGRNGRTGGAVINNNQQCPPCALQQPQQQIQYQDNTTFGQSFTSGFGIGLGVMSAVVLMDLLLPRFNYIGFGYHDMYGGYNSDVFVQVNNYYPGEEGNNEENEEEGNEEEENEESQEGSNDQQQDTGITEDEEYYDPGGMDDMGDMGDMGGGGRKGRSRRRPQNKKKGPRSSIKK